MNRVEFLDKLADLFATHGGDMYGGEAVTQREHALRGALLAEAAGVPSAEIAAVLLHDVGHLLHDLGDDCAEHGIDDKHEELGIRFLSKHLPPEVTEPARLHVQAKRFCAPLAPGTSLRYPRRPSSV